MVCVGLVAACLGEGLCLEVEGLVWGGYSGVADFCGWVHGLRVSKRCPSVWG